MKLLILYRPKSEHATTVESFVRDFQHQHGGLGDDVQLVSLDSREGADMARLYDITAYPGILVLTGDGGVSNMWTGEPLPLMSEVAAYLYGGG